MPCHEDLGSIPTLIDCVYLIINYIKMELHEDKFARFMQYAIDLPGDKIDEALFKSNVLEAVSSFIGWELDDTRDKFSDLND
mgnify:FL=1